MANETNELKSTQGSKFIHYQVYQNKGNNKFKCSVCGEPINGKVWKRSTMKSFEVLQFRDYCCSYCHEKHQSDIKSNFGVRKL